MHGTYTYIDTTKIYDTDRMPSTRRVYHLCTTFVNSPDNTQEMEQYTFGKQCGNENENPADNSVKHFTMKVAT